MVKVSTYHMGLVVTALLDDAQTSPNLERGVSTATLYGNQNQQLAGRVTFVNYPNDV